MICSNCGKELYLMDGDLLSECPFCHQQFHKDLIETSPEHERIIWNPENPVAIMWCGHISERYLTSHESGMEICSSDFTLQITDRALRLYNPDITIRISADEIDDVRVCDDLLFSGFKIYVCEGDPIAVSFGGVWGGRDLNKTAVKKIQEVCETQQIQQLREERRIAGEAAALAAERDWFFAPETKRTYEKYVTEIPLLLQKLTAFNSMLTAEASRNHRDQAFWDNRRRGMLSEVLAFARKGIDGCAENALESQILAIRDEIYVREVFIDKYERLKGKFGVETDSLSKFCSQCGMAVNLGDKFCRSCGSSIK